MGATESRHALKFRANGLAPSGVMGVWLLAGMLATGPARANDGEDVRQVPPPPVRVPVPQSAPAARKSHAPYVFFQPGGRTTYRPAAVEPGNIALVPPPAKPAYLYFIPGKRSTNPPAVGPVARPIVPDAAPPAVAAPPAAKEDVVANIPPPRPVTHPPLIFFTPRRDAAAKDRALRDSLPPLPPMSNAPKANERAADEQIPVRVPSAPGRKPLPYLIFQPQRLKVRPDAPPVEKGSSPSATSGWSLPDRIAAIETPCAARPTSPRRSTERPAPPTYRVVLDTRVEPATIAPLSFPEFDRALVTRPSAEPLPSGGLTRAVHNAAPSRTANRRSLADPEPIRLTGAVADSHDDALGPPIPAGLPPLLGSAGNARRSAP